MNPCLIVVIMMNNYFHDVATAMLFASALAMKIIIKKHEESGPGSLGHLIRFHRGISRIVTFSLVWIAVSAVPRILAFRSFELEHAYKIHNVHGLIAKHIIALGILIGGVLLWISLNKKMRLLQGSHR